MLVISVKFIIITRMILSYFTNAPVIIIVTFLAGVNYFFNKLRHTDKQTSAMLLGAPLHVQQLDEEVSGMHQRP